jgi:tetratricopeptide (TPR) repeat protein
MYGRCLIFLILLSSCTGSAGLLYAEEVKALRMIIVADRQEARKIRQQLVKGASFSALAEQKSIGPERKSWGYSGIVRLADMQPKLRSALRKLRPGQISKVIEIGRRHVIVKVISPQIERYYGTADRAAGQNKTDAAVKALKAALQLEEDSIKTYLKLAAVYNYARRYQDALPYLDKALQYAPQSTQVLMLSSAIYTKAAITDKNRAYANKALQGYQHVLQAHPRFAPAVHYGMGKVYLAALQQPRKAIGHLEKAIKNTPNVSEVYKLLIQAYYETKQYDKARDYLRLAQSLGFEFPKLRDALQNAKR